MHSRGVRVAAAGTGINFALGVTSCWYVARSYIHDQIVNHGRFDWPLAQLDDPAAAASLVFAFTMIIAGRMQDQVGPRVTAFIGASLLAVGFILTSLSTGFAAWIFGFGVCVGMGVGFGYAAATPPALHWFSRQQTGTVTGVVVAGYGLASLVVAPLTIHVVSRYGLQNAMLVLGTLSFVTVAVLAQFLATPRRRPTLFGTPEDEDHGISHFLRSPTAWLLWATFFLGAGASHMVIGMLSDLTRKSFGAVGFAAVAAMAVGNGGGRLAVGILSDRIGRPRALTAILAAQAVLVIAAASLAARGDAPTWVALTLIGLVGFNYGGNLSLYPCFVRDRFGLRDFGQNFGVIFTAWGVGTFLMARVSKSLLASTGSHWPAGLIACGLLVIGCLLSLRLREKSGTAPPRREPTPIEQPVM